VEGWEGFLAHLDSLGIRHTRVITRPENNSQFCYIHPGWGAAAFSAR
jgi:lactoylglutathione lyase